MNGKKKKLLHNKFFFFLKDMDNLHFIPNNILTNFFKDLTKYKNDYCKRLNFQFEINQTSKIVSQMRIYICDCVVQFSEITKE